MKVETTLFFQNLDMIKRISSSDGLTKKTCFRFNTKLMCETFFFTTAVGMSPKSWNARAF